LRDDLPPGGINAVLDAYRAEGARLVATAKAVDLITQALRGQEFVPQLAGSQDPRRTARAGS
jgi:hypothetical protein